MKRLAALLLMLLACAAARTEEPGGRVPANAESIATGRSLYIQNCQVCHGRRGKGDGDAASDLTRRPTNLTKLAKWSDAELFAGIAHGKKDMPKSENLLSIEQHWHLVNFIRTFAR
ncbi:MAG TPA: cytochrome c [Planctomycetota bacterium]|nr:cytochrome c [Planctomycetota bacterium]